MLIPLSKGMIAIVDDDVGEAITGRRWYAHRRGGKFYAASNVVVTPGRKGTSATLSMHRIVVGARPGEIVDHINGDPLDNRRVNLRICSRAQNKQNSRKRKATTSKYKGVRYRPGRKASTPPWAVFITVEGKRVMVGRYASELGAATAYDEAAKRYFGAFAGLNFHQA